MSQLNGSWRDEANDIWTIESNAKLLTVNGFGPRGPFKGFEMEASKPVLYVNFDDIKPETGVLSNEGKTIYWSSDTKWIRQ